jgi:hypothetical protein
LGDKSHHERLFMLTWRLSNALDGRKKEVTLLPAIIGGGVPLASTSWTSAAARGSLLLAA